MAAFNAGAYRGSAARGAPGLRFFIYAVLAIALMFLDRRGGWLDHVRYYMDAAVYPMQLAVDSPPRAWRWLQETFAARETLQADNARLAARDHELSLQALRLQALERENAELRGLKAALPPLAEHWLPAEVVNVELNGLRQRVLLNRGARNGVFRGQAVMDDAGLLGQTVRVSPWSAEVILITDPEHAVPVEIQRTGVHTIAVGTGDSTSLGLPYLPTNADVKPGDLLVTSGLGGVFPQGYPVARITEVRHNAVQPLAQIRATPLAKLDALHEVMLVWFDNANPAAPRRGEDGVGNPDFQPRNTPALEPLPPVAIPRLKPRPPTDPDTQADAQTSAPNASARTGITRTDTPSGEHANGSSPGARSNARSSSPASSTRDGIRTGDSGPTPRPGVRSSGPGARPEARVPSDDTENPR